MDPANPQSASEAGMVPDPCFVNSRREAILIFSLWVAALLWAVPFCYWNGYLHRVDPAELQTVLGIPSWLFWGVAVPWLLADVITVWFCFFYMTDDDLEPDPAILVDNPPRDVPGGDAGKELP